MVEEALSNYGLFIDDENRIRLIDPERLTDSAELRDECKDFIDSKHGDLLRRPDPFALQCRRARIQDDCRYVDRENGTVLQTGGSGTIEGESTDERDISTLGSSGDRSEEHAEVGR